MRHLGVDHGNRRMVTTDDEFGLEVEEGEDNEDVDGREKGNRGGARDALLSNLNSQIWFLGRCAGATS